jgi:hypothetical protein
MSAVHCCEYDFQSKCLQLCIRQFILLSKLGYKFRLNALKRHHEEYMQDTLCGGGGNYEGESTD